MMNADPITAYAVRTATGIALKLDRAAAEQYATQHHGTVHRLVEWAEPIPAHETDPEPPIHRMPQGHTTPGGLVRI